MLYRALLSCLFLSQATFSIAQQVSTDAATNLNVTYCSLNGRANAGSSSLNVSFEWGTTTSYGNTLSANPTTIQANASSGFSNDVWGLSPSTTYHYRAVAMTANGPIYGQDAVFTTPATSLPSLGSNGMIRGRADLFATFYADICPNNSATSITLQYGPTQTYGLMGTVTPSSLPSSLSFISVAGSITNLVANQYYHYRWVCTNAAGTKNGNDMTFSTVGVGVNNINGSEFSIYPNPTKGNLVIDMPAGVNEFQVMITDVTGRKVSVPAVRIGQKLQLDITHLRNGAYAITISAGNQHHSQIVVKQ